MTTQSSFPPTFKIAVLVFDDFEPLDVWGFCEAFAIARFIGTGYDNPPALPFTIQFVSTEAHGKTNAPAPVRSYNGPRVAPDLFFEEALKKPFDLLMIPGGKGVGTLLKGPRKDEILAWIRAMDKHVGIMSSVCTGAAMLAASGILDGKPAATNHAAFAWVTTFGPRVLWDSVRRWVDAGRYVTSAGVSAGTDMAFYLVERIAGRAVAEAAALGAEYDWHRDPEEPIYYPAGASVPSSRS